MRKIIFWIAGALWAPAIFAQTARVSQQPEPRNFLIEEFTGIHCSYCPQAHTIAQNLQTVWGERVQVIAVHAGNLAAPNNGEVDFRTECGAAWYAASGSTAMPAGALNRTRYPQCARPDSYELGRGEWSEVIRSLTAEKAAVNLFAEASLDTLSRTLNVRTEHYFLQGVEGAHRLTLALTEDFVRGTQAGTEQGKQYLHRHALCDVITSVWGDSIGTAPQEVYTRNFSYQIPDAFGNRAPNLNNLYVTAFVTDDSGRVLNTVSCPVLFAGRYTEPSAEIRITALSERYSRYDIPVRVLNLGTDTLRSVRLSVNWGDLSLEPETQDLHLAIGQEEEVWFHLGDYPLKDLNKFFIQTLQVNGQDYASNRISGFTRLPYEVGTDSVRITLTPLAPYGGDLTYAIRARSGEVICSGSFETKDGTEAKGDSRTFSIPLPQGACYSLEISDAFLDGGSGGYTLSDENGKIIVSETETGFYGTVVSFYRPAETGNIETARSLSKPLYRVYPNPAAGLFFVETNEGVNAEVYTANGLFVGNYKWPAAGIHTLNLRGKAAGLYYLRLSAGQNTATVKLMVR